MVLLSKENSKVNKISSFDQAIATQFHKELDVIEKYGRGPGSGSILNVSKLEQKFLAYAESYGLDRNILNTKFVGTQGKVKIVGWDTKQKKNKVILEDENGENYKCPVSYVKMYHEQYKNFK